MSSKGTSTRESTGRADTQRGPILDKLSELLKQGRNIEVFSLVQQLLLRNSELEKRLAKRNWTGNEAEGVTSEQLSLFLQALQQEAQQELQTANEKLQQAAQEPNKPALLPKPPSQPRVRRPVPDHLRRVDNPIAVPASDRGCPVCGQERACIDHDVTEVIELVPAEVIVRIDRREVLACKACEGEMDRAPIGDKVIAGGIYGSALVSSMLVRKYDHGMTLHRLREELLRLGLDMPSASASDQICWATDLLSPLWHQAQQEVLQAKFMQLDPTHIPVRDKEQGYSIQLGSLCAYIGDRETVVYLYASTGKKNAQRIGELGPEDFLMLRRGLTMADASNAFDKSFQRPELIEVGCNMHARRYFSKALDSGDTRAALAIAVFKRIYDIEEDASNLSDDERTALRQQKSKPIYEELLAWCKLHLPHEPPKTPLAAACAYLINHDVALMRFLDDGSIPPDNGLVERIIAGRP